jgi:hypothetical protein
MGEFFEDSSCPMDERPPNYQLVSMIADLNGIEIELPKKSLLGRYMKPGECEELIGWMLSREADRFIISVDMLSYGGLIASREEEISAETALERLRSVRELRRRFPMPRFSFPQLSGERRSQFHRLARKNCGLCLTSICGSRAMERWRRLRP